MTSIKIKRHPITDDEIELAIEALKECSDSEGLTPVRSISGSKLTPGAVLRKSLGMTERRSFAVLSRLKKAGLVIPTEHSTKVIIREMMTDINEGSATPQPTVVTVERIRAALLKLSGENATLREEKDKLQAEVDDLRRRVQALESNGSLDQLLKEIEQAA